MKANDESLSIGKWVKLAQDDQGGDLKAGAVVQLIVKQNVNATDAWTVRLENQQFSYVNLNTEVEEVKVADTQEVKLPEQAPHSTFNWHSAPGGTENK